jgi:hypothetical protein
MRPCASLMDDRSGVLSIHIQQKQRTCRYEAPARRCTREPRSEIQVTIYMHICTTSAKCTAGGVIACPPDRGNDS